MEKRERYALILLLLLAAVIRLAYLFEYSQLPDWSQLTVDNYYHHNWAQDIAGGDVVGDTTYFRAPAYVWLLGLLYSIFGSSLWVGRLLGFAIGIATVATTYFLGRRVGGHRTGLIAGWLYALYPLAYYFEFELLLDPLFTLLLTLTFLWFLRWRDSLLIKDAAVAGLLLGAAAITRPTALVFYPLLLLIILVPRAAFAVRYRGALVWLLAACIPVGVTFVRNIAVAGDAVPVASQSGINLYIGNNPDSDGISAVLPEPMGHNWEIKQITEFAERGRGMKLSPAEVSSYWRERAIEWITSNPTAFISHTLQKLYRHVASREVSNNRDLAAYFVLTPLLNFNPLRFGLIFALAALGTVVVLRERTSARLLVGAVALYIVVTSLFFFSSRFRLPLLPFYCTLAGIGISAFVHAVKAHRTRTMLLPLAAAVIAAAVSFAPLLPPSGELASQYLTAEGHYYYSTGQYETALLYHKAALDINPAFPENNLNVGVTYIRMGEADSARKYLEIETQLHPMRYKAYTNLASLALVSGNITAAIEYVRQALMRADYDVTANAVHLRCLIEDSTFADELPVALRSAATATDSNIYTFYDAGVRLTEDKHLDLAREALMIAAGSEPPPIETNDNAFHPNFRQSDRLWNQEKAKVFSQLCFISGTTERYRDAIGFGHEAVKHDPDLVDGYINLISAYLAVNRRSQADSVVTLALERFPDNDRLLRLKYYSQ